MLYNAARFFALLLCGMIMFGCSSGSGVSDDFKDLVSIKNDKGTFKYDKKKAMEHFVNGSVAQTNGEYQKAIQEFESALLYDTASSINYELARTYYMTGTNKYPLAIQTLKKAITQNPVVPEYYILASDIFMNSRQYDSAAAYLESILTFDTTKIDVYYRLARIYEPEKPLRAIEIYNHITELIGFDWDVALRVSDLQEKLGNHQAAIETVNEILENDPGNIYVKKLLFELHRKKKDYDKALSLIDDILEVDPDDIEAREKKAQLFIEQENWKAAAGEYIFLIMNPEIPYPAKLQIAESYYVKSFTDTILKSTAKEIYLILDNDTSKYDAKLILGAIAYDEGNDSLAVSYFSKIPPEGLQAVSSWLRLSGIYYDNKRYSTVTKILSSVYGDMNSVFEVNLLIGISYTNIGNFMLAKEFLLKAVELSPKDFNALSALGFTLNRLGENDDAVKFLNDALKIDPDNVDILGQLGMIYDSMEKWSLCDSVYERAVTLEPDNALVNNNYAYSLSERGLQLERAFKMIKIAIEKEPFNSSYLDTYGWIYYRLGEFDKAIENINKAIEVAGESSVMLDHLGDVYFAKNDKDKALHYWKKALEMDKANIKIKNKIDTGGF